MNVQGHFLISSLSFSGQLESQDLNGLCLVCVCLKKEIIAVAPDIFKISNTYASLKKNTPGRQFFKPQWLQPCPENTLFM